MLIKTSVLSLSLRNGRGVVPYSSCRFRFSVPGVRRWSAAVSFIAGSTIRGDHPSE
jgi:hypothetical protein